MGKVGLASAFETASEFLCQVSRDSADSLVTESLDLAIALIPFVAVWARSGKSDGDLTARACSWTNRPLEVYTADVKEPMISGSFFCQKDVLLCPPTCDDLDIKRALFAEDHHETTIRRIIHITSLILTGAIATMGSAPLMAALLYAPLYCLANAYTQDIAFLEAFPEEKQSLIQKRSSETLPPTAGSSSLKGHCLTTLFYLSSYLPALLKSDVVANFEVTIAEPMEVEPPKPNIIEIQKIETMEVEEPEPKLENLEMLDPRLRGGHRGR